jgi:hypothetical protein
MELPIEYVDATIFVSEVSAMAGALIEFSLYQSEGELISIQRSVGTTTKKGVPIRECCILECKSQDNEM